DLMSDYFRSHRLRDFERDREYLTLAEHTMNELTGSLDPRLGLAMLMKTIREHAQSEHAFLLRRESIRGRWRAVGAAGLVEIDRKADGIGQIERASSVFQAMFPENGAMTSAQIPKVSEERDRDLARLWNTFAITELQWIKPLFANLSATDNSKPRWATSDAIPLKTDVAILLTWSGIDKPPSRCSEQCALIARLGLSALQIRWWKKALLASKTTKTNAMAFASPGSWPRPVKWLVSLTLLSFVFALPVPIQLHATAMLVPLVQQHVFAPMDATVEAVLVDHGQSVKLGDPLIRLRSPSLSAEYEQTFAQQLRNAQRLEDIEATLLRETALSRSHKEELEGERKTIASIRPIETIQLASLRKQLESLLVVANVDGVVSTWNVQESLKDRPLRTGQWLMSIHASESPWILEATLSERDSYEFRLAMENGQNQPVAMMTSLPQTELPVRLRKSFLPRIDSGKHADAAFDPNSSVLRLQFDIEAETIPAKVAIAGATARITIPVGRGPLIWALCKDFANNVWTRIQLW
ncbi:MAG TPA: biotin/lipoyl-binding protein, partial [Pirellula sp.]|nr:biotin/lipoyl-binding protein [Pirellula sp.]